MGWQDDVAAAFAPQGPIGGLFEVYRPRVEQVAMANAVAEAIGQGDQLIVQAGTGIGKSFAYLVPVLLSGKRAVIATATKALQDQLALQDLPKLLAALARPAKVATLKGRSSYLCLHRLGSAGGLLDHLDVPTEQELRMVQHWATATCTGDIAELRGLRERSPLVPVVTSTAGNCVGTTCHYWAQCHVNKARDAAHTADLVITNHHLFFADAALDLAPEWGLLPQADVVVFDEAHRIPELGVQALAEAISVRELDRFCENLIAQSTKLVLGAAHWRDWIVQMQAAIAPCRRAQVPVDAELEPPQDILWEQVARQLQGALSPLAQLLSTLAELSPVIGELQRQAQHWLSLLATFLRAPHEGQARWIEFGPSARLVQGAVNVAAQMQSIMASGSHATCTKTAWIFTSATLGRDAGLSWFADACGLRQAKVLRLESPFDYGRQAALYIPASFPLPHEVLHSSEVAHLVAQGATILGGRTLVLTTSLRAMQAIAEALKKHLRPAGEVVVLVQGEASKRELLERFAQAQTGQCGVVLVASATFWEGVDIAGPALQMVVIDKIPFAPPNDPVVQARIRELQKQGKNAFAHFQIEHAAVALMQGAGRLIRGVDDCGVLVICDARLLQKGYGRKLIAALPAMSRLDGHRDFIDQLRKITTSATMDHGWT